MMTMPKFRLFLMLLCTLCFPVLGQEQVSIRVEVKSDLNHFGGKLLRGLKLEVLRSGFFEWQDEERLLDGSQGHLNVAMSYPLRAFPGQKTLYVKVEGLVGGPRYLCYSHVQKERGDALSVAQGDKLISQVAQRLVKQLAWNWNKDERGVLTPGYFANRYDLDLGKALEVELVRPVGSVSRPLADLKNDQLWERTTSLADKERIVQDLALPSSEQIPEPRKRFRRRQNILHQLESETKSAKRADLFVEMADLHSEVGLKKEAVEYVDHSLQENPSLKAYTRKSILKGPNQDPISRLRRWNQDRSTSLSLKFGLEYDSNVVREEVDSFVDSDSRDWKLSLDGSWSQLWKLKSWGWNNRTHYEIHNENHTRHSEQDVIFQRLMHGWGQQLTQGDWKYDLSLELGLHHLMGRGKSLMWGLGHRVGMEWYRSSENIFSVFLLGSEKDFSKEFFDSEERSGDHRVLKFGWSHGFSSVKRVSFGVGWLLDDLGDATLSYDGYALDGRYDTVDVYGLFDKASLVGRYEKRDYKAPEFGRTVREDAEFYYGIEAEKQIFERHLLSLAYGFTDHQSTRRVSKYRRNQLSLAYLVSF
jgi:hypothetical protein